MSEPVETTATENPTIDNFSMNVDFENGLQVGISVTFPKGNGMAVIHAFQKLGQQAGLIGLLEALSYDQSVQEKLDELGLSVDGDEDLDDDDISDEDAESILSESDYQGDLR